MEILPDIGTVDLKDFTDRELRRYLLGDLEHINDTRLGREEEGLMFSYVDDDNWYGYGIILGPYQMNQTEPHSVLLTKVDRRDYVQLEETKELSIPRGWPLNRRQNDIFSSFDREELEAIATVLADYRESAYARTRRDDKGLLLPYWSVPEQPLMEIIPEAPQLLPNEALDTATLGEIRKEFKKRAVRDDSGMLTLSLYLSLDELSYVACFSGRIPHVLDSIDVGCFYNNQPFDRFIVSFGERQIVEEQPERPIVWTEHVFSDILYRGQQIAPETAQSILEDTFARP